MSEVLAPTAPEPLRRMSIELVNSAWRPAAAVLGGCLLVSWTGADAAGRYLADKTSVPTEILTLAVALQMLGLGVSYAPLGAGPGIRSLITRVAGTERPGLGFWAGLAGMLAGYTAFLGSHGYAGAAVGALSATLSIVALYMMAWVQPHLDVGLRNGQPLSLPIGLAALGVHLGCAAWVVALGGPTVLDRLTGIFA